MQTTVSTTVDVTPGSPTMLPSVADIFLFIIVIGIFTYVLHKQIQSPKATDTSSMKPNLTLLIVSLFLIALFAPSNLNIYLSDYYNSIYLIGMSWEIIGLYLGDFALSFTYFLVGLPFMFFRFVFVYYVYKYYQGHTTKKRVLISGILGELQFFLIGLAIIPIGLSNPYIAAIVSVPIPILLIAGLVILRYVPRVKGTSDWTGSDESKEWWDKKAADAEN